MKEAEITLHRAFAINTDPTTYGPGFSGPGEFILWHRQDGKVFYYLGNEGEQLPNGSYFHALTRVEELNLELGIFGNFMYGPGMKIERNVRGTIRRCDFLPGNNGVWGEVVYEGERWDFKGIDGSIAGNRMPYRYERQVTP